MTRNAYQKDSVASIMEHAKGLMGRSLAEVVELPRDVGNKRNRGNLGLLLEKYYFELAPSSDGGPDFGAANLELKTTGVRRTKSGYRAKERLVLKMINYETIVDEEWNESELLRKCSSMLILFYLHDESIPAYDQRFVLEPLLYRIPDADLAIIKRDWLFIRDRVRDGRAHELSEGDTFYLGACRKGSGGAREPLRRQPYSDTRAKARAFSFKPSYVNSMIGALPSDSESIATNRSRSIEKATKARFEPYLGLSVEEISNRLGYRKNGRNHKGFLRELTHRMLSESGRKIREFENADIEMKTIRTRADGIPKESMSFPAFKYVDIVKEEWEESDFCRRLEKKFLFVVFHSGVDGIDRLQRVEFWSMPYADRMEAKRVFEETKVRVVKNPADLPKSHESRVAHVRPHAAHKLDTYPTPQGGELVKQSFWLNNTYIAEVLRTI